MYDDPDSDVCELWTFAMTQFSNADYYVYVDKTPNVHKTFPGCTVLFRDVYLTSLEAVVMADIYDDLMHTLEFMLNGRH